jgi:hypothetical protein
MTDTKAWFESASTESKAVVTAVLHTVDVLRLHWGNRQPQARDLAESLLREVTRVAALETNE